MLYEKTVIQVEEINNISAVEIRINRANFPDAVFVGSVFDISDSSYAASLYFNYELDAYQDEKIPAERYDGYVLGISALDYVSQEEHSIEFCLPDVLVTQGDYEEEDIFNCLFCCIEQYLSSDSRREEIVSLIPEIDTEMEIAVLDFDFLSGNASSSITMGELISSLEEQQQIPYGWDIVSAHYSTFTDLFGTNEGDKTIDEFVEYLYEHSDIWHPNHNLWLFACDAAFETDDGDLPVAQRLSNILQVRVKAARGRFLLWRPVNLITRRTSNRFIYTAVCDLQGTMWDNYDIDKFSGTILELIFKLYIRIHALKDDEAWEVFYPEL